MIRSTMAQSEGILRDKQGVPDENESEEQVSDSEQEEESEHVDQEEEEFIHTPSPTDDKDDENLESESDEVIKSDEEKGLDDTTYQFDDDVDARLKESTQTDKEKTEVPTTSSSRSSDLASKFLIFLDIPHTDAKIVSPLDIHVHHEVPRTQTPTLLNITGFLVSHARIKEQVKDQLPQILPKEVSNFAPPVIEKLIKESRDEVTLAKVSGKIKISTSGSSKDTKSQPKPSGKSVYLEEPVFEVADLDMPQDQEGNPGDNEDNRKECSKSDWFKKPTPPQEPTDPDWHDFDELYEHSNRILWIPLEWSENKNCNSSYPVRTSYSGILYGTRSNYTELEYDFEECYKALLEKLDWENPEGGDYPFDLSKPLPLIMRGKRQRSKAAQYDLPGIEDIGSKHKEFVKVSYDDMHYGCFSHWIHRVSYMRKHGYGYLEGIVVRRANNILYRFKEESAHKYFKGWCCDFTIALEKMEHIGKEGLISDQGHQQAVKERRIEEFGEICCGIYKEGRGEFQRSFRHSDTERLSRSDEVLKLKNFKKDAALKLFKSTNQESQDKGTSSSLKSMITTSIHKLMIEVKDYELKTNGSLLQWFYVDDTEILEPAKSRCHIIRLQDPVTHEVATEMETKAQIKLRFKKATGKDVSTRSFQSTEKALKMEYKFAVEKLVRKLLLLGNFEEFGVVDMDGLGDTQSKLGLLSRI
ncbi:hypothetical protein Tco_0355849 [Tanacetum coccineum]